MDVFHETTYIPIKNLYFFRVLIVAFNILNINVFIFSLNRYSARVSWKRLIGMFPSKCNFMFLAILLLMEVLERAIWPFRSAYRIKRDVEDYFHLCLLINKGILWRDVTDLSLFRLISKHLILIIKHHKTQMSCMLQRVSLCNWLKCAMVC